MIWHRLFDIGLTGAMKGQDIIAGLLVNVRGIEAGQHIEGRTRIAKIKFGGTQRAFLEERVARGDRVLVWRLSQGK